VRVRRDRTWQIRDDTRRWQIRDDTRGLAIYTGDSAAQALAAFLRDKVRASPPGDYKVAQFGDGTASVLWRGIEYRNYRATAVE
jgi:hypothetical protein